MQSIIHRAQRITQPQSINQLTYLHSTQNYFKPNIYSIEGNIGSGKSTLLKIIERAFKEVQIIKEPVQNWQCIGGDPELNLLDLFYQDPKRWAYSLQTYAYFSRLQQWEQMEVQKKNVVCERSVLSDKYIFALNGYKQGFFNKMEWALYNQYFDFLVEKFQANKLSAIIYLHTEPSICSQRIQRRKRQGESTISLDYLKQIHQRHEDWLNMDQMCKIPVSVIDGNEEFQDNIKRQDEIIKQLKQIIQQ